MIAHELDDFPALASEIPDRILCGLRDYVLHRTATGSFLAAVLANDLHDAVCRADPESLAAIGSIVRYVYNALPAPCWGSRKAVEAWLARPMSEKETIEDAKAGR